MHKIRTDFDINAYACTTANAFPYSRFAFLKNSFLRTANGSKSLRAVAVVPALLGTALVLTTFPSASYSIFVPHPSSNVRVVTVNSPHIPHMDDNASPRNPNVVVVSKSSNARNLLVAYFFVNIPYDAPSTPEPLSLTSTTSVP